MTMIERVARAICGAAGIDPDRKGSATEWRWQEFSDEARAALEAMREPTDLMGLGLPSGYKPGSHSATEIWRAMIDAALNEEPSE